MNLKGKSFLKLLDFTPAEIGELIDFAAELKAKKKENKPRQKRAISALRDCHLTF